MRPSCTILESTLREGEQTPYIYFTHRQKLDLARMIDEAGVDIIEAGVPAMGDSERRTLEEIGRLRLHAEVVTWNRMKKEDIWYSVGAGISSVHISVPASELLIKKKIGMHPLEALDKLAEILDIAQKEGCRISVGAEDASRADPLFLQEILKLAVSFGAVRFRYADTLGLLTPDKTFTVISKLKKNCPIPIDFHAHNDFGLATANALAAFRAGAETISCTVLGLGERAGHTGLEEFAGCLKFLLNLPVGINFKKLGKLCTRVAEVTGTAIPSAKPLFGRNVFTHESGIHVDAQLKHDACYEPITPEAIGRKRKIIPGKYSGSASIRYLALQKGIRLTDEQADSIITRLRQVLFSLPAVNVQKLFEQLLLDEVRDATHN
jgi:homocitrate synthase NifV